MDTSPEQANFILRYLAEIVLGLIVVLLSVLKLLGKKQRAEEAKSVLTDKQATQTDLMALKMEIKSVIQVEFTALRRELQTQWREDMRTVHSRIDKVVSNK